MFNRKTVAFLKELQQNNNRVWFAANKQRYEDEVRTPAFDYIEAMDQHMTKISPHYIVSTKKVGGSLMRVHKDIRFSTEHPLLDDLKRKDFIAVHNLKVSSVYAKDFDKTTAKLFKAASPLVKFICEADDLAF